MRKKCCESTEVKVEEIQIPAFTIPGFTDSGFYNSVFYRFPGPSRGGGVPGVTTPGPRPKRGPDTNCYKFTSTARYEVKLIAD